MPPRKNNLPLHVSLHCIEEERRNVVRRTQTRIAKLQGIYAPANDTTAQLGEEQFRVYKVEDPLHYNIPFAFGFCICILLLYTTLSFAHAP